MKRRLSLNKRYALSATAIMSVVGIALSGCSATPANRTGEESIADMEPVTFTVSDVLSAGGLNDAGWQSFIKEVSEGTDGKVTFEMFYGSVLFPPNEGLDAVGDGRVDLSWTNTAYTPKDLPLSNVFFDLEASPSAEFPLHPLVSSAVLTHFAKSDEAFKAQFNDRNVEVLGVNSAFTGYDLYCTTPIESVKDLEGKRVRAPGVAWAGQAKALGMVPVDISSTDLYQSLQRGVVDCGINTLTGLRDQSMWEVAPYLVAGVFAANPGSIWLMNKEKLDALPADARDVIVQAGARLALHPGGGVVKYMNAYSEVMAEAPEHGVTLFDGSPISQALKGHNSGVGDGIATKLKAAGVADPQAWLDEYRAQWKRWEGVLRDDIGMTFATLDQGTEEIAKSYANYDREKVTAFLDLVEAEYYK